MGTKKDAPSSIRGIRDLFRHMRMENPLLGAPRPHGELLMLGIEVAESTVPRYKTRRQGHLAMLEDISAQPPCRIASVDPFWGRGHET